MPRTTKSVNGSLDSPKPARQPKKGNGATRHFNDPDAVARRAYELFQNRGGNHGADLDDWLEAERQLNGGAGELTGRAPAKPRRRKSSEGTV